MYKYLKAVSERPFLREPLKGERYDSIIANCIKSDPKLHISVLFDSKGTFFQ
jgi:hypothetical protein